MKKVKRKKTALLTALLLTGSMLFGCGTQKQGEPTTEPDTTQASASEETPAASGTLEGKRLEGVTLVFTDDVFNPYRIVGEDGSLSGYDFDVLTDLQGILGFEYEFKEVEFAAVLSSISAGTADFGMTLTPTDERKETFDFTDAYYVPRSGVGSLPESGITGWEDLKGKTVIAPSSTLHAQVAHTIEGATVLEMENIALGCEEVASGRADALVADSVQLSVYAEEYGMDEFVTSVEDHGIEMSGYTLGFIKGSEYIDDFNYALEILKENGTLTELQKKWLGEGNAIEY